MKKVIAATFFGCLLLAAPATSETRLKMSVPWDGKTEIDILIMPFTTARLIVENGSLSIIHNGGAVQSILTGMVKEEKLNGQWGLHFGDFNMDGYQDFAVDVAYGYGGVNIFSNVYSYNIDSGQFDKLLEEVPNIELRSETKELASGQKSGPRYYRTIYRFNDGKPYKYKDNVVMMNGLELVTVYDRSGGTIKKLVVDMADEEMGLKDLVPAVREITTKRAWIFKQPEDKAKTKNYLIKGDKVELLDTKGDWDGWFKIRFDGKKIYEGWIRSEDLNLDG